VSHKAKTIWTAYERTVFGSISTRVVRIGSACSLYIKRIQKISQATNQQTNQSEHEPTSRSTAVPSNQLSKSINTSLEYINNPWIDKARPDQVTKSIMQRVVPEGAASTNTSVSFI
jgi:hypothetical protein